MTFKHNSPTWIKLWFGLSTLLVFWDAGYCLLRPHSMKGGYLSLPWRPYELYATIDLVYGPAAFLRHDGFTAAQALLNLVENSMNITYLFLARCESPPATTVVLGMSAVLFTFWKTVLYWLMDYMCGPDGWCQTGHNSRQDWWILFAIPNGFWILVPGIIACIFGAEITRGLSANASIKSKTNAGSPSLRGRTQGDHQQRAVHLV